MMYESTEVLNDRYLIHGTPHFEGKIDFLKIFTSGFEIFATYFLPEFDRLLQKTLIAIVNENLDNDEALSINLKQPKILIEYIMDILANRGFLKLVKTNDSVFVSDVSVQGKRAARELSN